MSVKVQLAPQRPLLKLFAIKAVGECISLPVFIEILILRIVFLTFWQATLISLLATFGLVKDVRIPLERFYDEYSPVPDQVYDCGQHRDWYRRDCRDV